MTMTRKQFLRSVLGVGIGAVGVAAIAGCGSDGGGGGGGGADAPPPTCSAPGTVIQANHSPGPHVMMVTMADVVAGVAGAAKTYDIMGGQLHTHMVTISAAQFVMLKNGAMLSLTSTSDGTHTHTINVMCAT